MVVNLLLNAYILDFISAHFTDNLLFIVKIAVFFAYFVVLLCKVN